MEVKWREVVCQGIWKLVLPKTPYWVRYDHFHCILRLFHCFQVSLVSDGMSVVSKFLFPHMEYILFSGCFQDFFFNIFFQWFEYDMPWHGFLWFVFWLGFTKMLKSIKFFFFSIYWEIFTSLFIQVFFSVPFFPHLWGLHYMYIRHFDCLPQFSVSVNFFFNFFFLFCSFDHFSFFFF